MMTNNNKGRFKKGQTAWNKGMKGLTFGQSTQFRKHRVNNKTKPVGAEYDRKDGYTWVKISEKKSRIVITSDDKFIQVSIVKSGRDIWREKHVLIWEAANGPRPKGHAVIFGDGNKRNFALDNLILVSRAQLAVICHKGLIFNDADLTRSGLLIADLNMKMNEKQRNRKRNQERKRGK